MKVLLNLLPEEGRASIRRKYYGRFFFWQSVKLLLVGVFYLCVLGSVFFILSEDRRSVEQAEAYRSATQSEVRALETYEKKFQEANLMATQANRFDREHLSWTELLRIMDRIVPENVMFTSLSTKNYQVFLSGIAVTRDDFLALEQRLKEESCFDGIQAPVSNLFSVKNVEFQIDFSVKRECIKGK